MACNKCGSKMVGKTWTAIVIAILINVVLIVIAYNYAHYLAYKESIQIIKLDNYRSEKTGTEKKNIQFENIDSIVYFK